LEELSAVATLHEDQLLGCLRAEARSKYPCLKACAEGAVDSRTIGEGGMATVGSRFTAKGTLCCTKELKFLGENCYTPLAAAFEIKALLHLRHDNVLRGLGFFQSGSNLKIVLPYMDRRCLLSDWQANKTSYKKSRPAVSHVCIGLARALAYLHDCQIVHRDVKPANILLSSGNEVKLADFGVSRHLGFPDQFPPEGPLGTQTYSPPEQWLESPPCGQTPNEKVDIWAFGVVLAELLTAVEGAPFPPWVLPEERFDKFLYSYADRVTEKRCRDLALPEDDASLVRLCLSKRMDKRPTANELLSKISSGRHQTSH